MPLCFRVSLSSTERSRWGGGRSVQRAVLAARVQGRGAENARVFGATARRLGPRGTGARSAWLSPRPGHLHLGLFFSPLRSGEGLGGKGGDKHLSSGHRERFSSSRGSARGWGGGPGAAGPREPPATAASAYPAASPGGPLSTGSAWPRRFLGKREGARLSPRPPPGPAFAPRVPSPSPQPPPPSGPGARLRLGRGGSLRPGHTQTRPPGLALPVPAPLHRRGRLASPVPAP